MLQCAHGGATAVCFVEFIEDVPAKGVLELGQRGIHDRVLLRDYRVEFFLVTTTVGVLELGVRSVTDSHVCLFFYINISFIIHYR